MRKQWIKAPLAEATLSFGIKMLAAADLHNLAGDTESAAFAYLVAAPAVMPFLPPDHGARLLLQSASTSVPALKSADYPLVDTALAALDPSWAEEMLEAAGEKILRLLTEITTRVWLSDSSEMASAGEKLALKLLSSLDVVLGGSDDARLSTLQVLVECCQARGDAQAAGRYRARAVEIAAEMKEPFPLGEPMWRIGRRRSRHQQVEVNIER